MRTLLPWLALQTACATSIQLPPAAPDAVTVQARPAHDVELELKHDGRTRRYRVHLPPNHDRRTPLPLVVVLHGGGGNGAYAARMSLCARNSRTSVEILFRPMRQRTA